jgi:hypothetical protein
MGVVRQKIPHMAYNRKRRPTYKDLLEALEKKFDCQFKIVTVLHHPPSNMATPPF